MQITWRNAVREDEPALMDIWERHDVMVRELAPTVKIEHPKLFMPEGESLWGPYQAPIIMVRVAEREGVAVAFVIVEAVCEVQVIGADQDVIKTLGRELPEECHMARGFGFRSGWGLVPKEIVKPIERSLRHSPLRAWPNLVLVGCDFSELGD